jgi:hypothetical protein
MSGGRRHLTWLRDELPGLVESGTLDASSAARLTEFYRLDRLGTAGDLRRLVLAVLGAALIGAGVILLLAHNWDQLPRGARACLMVGELLLAQAALAYALRRHPHSRAMREACATLLALSVGAAIALVSQTYHIGGDFGDFTLLWVGLVAPMIYLVPSQLLTSLVAVSGLALAFQRELAFDQGLSFYALQLVLLPALRRSRDAERSDGLVQLARYSVALSLTVGSFGMARAHGVSVVHFAGLFGCIIALCARQRSREAGVTQAWGFIGEIGSVLLLLAMSYEEFWLSLMRSREPHAHLLQWSGWAIAASLVLAAAALLRGLTWARDAVALCMLGALAGAVLIGGISHADIGHALLAALGNLLAFALGAAVFSIGLRRRRADVANMGMATLAALFILRFFDSDLSFLLRGIGFVAIGAWLGRNRSGRERA